MPTKFESSRIHGNSNMASRKRTRIIFAIAVITLFALLMRPSGRRLLGMSTGTSVASLADSQKASNHLESIMENGKSAASDTAPSAGNADPVSATHLQANADTAANSDTADGGVKKTAKIITCPACRLNSLPLVKKFVYDHAPNFKPNLDIDFKVGEDPVLHLYEDGKETSVIKLEVSC